MKVFSVSLLYSGLLYSVTALFLWAVVYFFHKKRDIRVVVGICIAVIAFDLFLFDLIMNGHALSGREKIMFKENPTSFVFEDKRALSMLSDDVFNNFRPTMYKKHVAISSRTFSSNFFRNKMKIKLYPFFQSATCKYPLKEELNSMNIEEFIKYGMAHIGEWPAEKRIFFSDILLSIAEDLTLYKYFYMCYLDIGGISQDIMEDIRESLPYFSGNINEWPLRESIENKILAMFHLPSLSLHEVENVDTLAISKVKILRNPLLFRFLINTLTAQDFLIYSTENNIADEHVFVLLKDYYDLVFYNKTLSPIEGHFIPLGHKLKHAMGVEAPIIRFYSRAYFVDKKDVLTYFGYSAPLDDKLFLSGGENAVMGEGSGENDFSYTISHYGPNTLNMDYDADRGGFIYYSDCFDNHWKAFIDGEKTNVYLANAAFKAIKVPKGRHKVKFVYDPTMFRYSLWCYYVTFSVSLAYLVLGALVRLVKDDIDKP